MVWQPLYSLVVLAVCPTLEWHGVAAIVQFCGFSNVSHIGMAWCGSHCSLVVLAMCPALEWDNVEAIVQSCGLSDFGHNGMAWCGSHCTVLWF